MVDYFFKLLRFIEQSNKFSTQDTGLLNSLSKKKFEVKIRGKKEKSNGVQNQ
jgi:hypothetical protein